MNVSIALLMCSALSVALPLTPQRSEAQVVNVLATKLFDTTSGGERNGLAFDAATQRLYVADGTGQLRAYTLDAARAGPDPLPGDGRPVEIGLHVVREATSIGGTAVPAGTFTYIQGGSPSRTARSRRRSTHSTRATAAISPPRCSAPASRPRPTTACS